MIERTFSHLESVDIPALSFKKLGCKEFRTPGTLSERARKAI